MSQEQDALDAAYRRANAAQTERPSMATRQAILAHAAKVAHQRTPAANDSRFVWRAVAGVAVLGVAVLLWRQVDHRLPGQTPQQVVDVRERADAAPTIAPTQELPLEAAAAPAAAAAAAPSPAPPPPAAAPPDQTLPSELASVDAQAPVAANESLALSAGAPMPAAIDRSAADSERLEEVQVTAARSSQQSRPATIAAGAQEAEATDLLREHFPAAMQSRERRTVWLVRDSQGVVVMSGELGESQRLADVTKQLEPTYGASLGNWRTQTATNDRNQRIVVAIAELRP